MRFRILHILLIMKFLLCSCCKVNQEQQHIKKRWLFSGQSVTKLQLEVSSKTPSLWKKAASPYTTLQFILLSKTHWFPYIH